MYSTAGDISYFSKMKHRRGHRYASRERARSCAFFRGSKTKVSLGAMCLSQIGRGVVVSSAENPAPRKSARHEITVRDRWTKDGSEDATESKPARGESRHSPQRALRSLLLLNPQVQPATTTTTTTSTATTTTKTIEYHLASVFPRSPFSTKSSTAHGSPRLDEEMKLSFRIIILQFHFPTRDERGRPRAFA